MVDTTKQSAVAEQATSSDIKVKKHIKLTEITYRRNCDSDYTEKIEALDKQFNYSNDSDYYWSEPELSLFYGTPLYEEASLSQKLALNHLYWATQYNQTAATEANAVLYNQVTAGVFGNIGGYETLCQELALETEQERHHIHAFHMIGYKTKRALLSQSAFNASAQGKSSKKNDLARGLTSKRCSQIFTFDWQSSPLSMVQEYIFRFATNQVLLKKQAHCYSQYLKELEEKGESIPAQTTGLLGQLAPRPLLQFFTLNCGSSPFLACVFYTTRYMANMLIKNYEYRYSHYYRELEKQGEFIPVPVAVSHYHLLDESFHTTTSQLIAQDLYKDFPKPTAYEQFLANLTIYRAQSVVLKGLSGGLPAIFRSDASFMLSFYKLLQSPVFDMSAEEALQWLKRCLCQEQEGFHVTLKYHHRLLTELRRMFDPIDYLWPVNRELRLMAAGGSIHQAIQQNIKAFEQFSRSVA
ncbi:hypothetical protein [Chroogloeocystis siderophila]|jgi:hypothetical protein|uniref:Uncharacterized protein n=1 Tax=Chroogloeocystis siderophila 5.2 s.c.1 TaxID=247279 RepID=A0A1U7HS81_9CHRO|nr:hypothetical protein [Chroogloeocystis siderophila]OKH26446.1 hypothetical protein NIES1031_11955 [Chroogloeocystis siderophila 5.2 s.c.1]